MQMLKVTFIIIARNSERDITGVLVDLRNQSYSKDLIEVILVDGCSNDKTRNIMEKFACQNGDCFAKVLVLDNNKRILASGWNIALAFSTGAIILRVDAHSSIPNDFIQKNVQTLIRGHMIAGGHTISKYEKGNILGYAEKSMFGAGLAQFRNIGEAKFVDTLAYAAYRREVFVDVGGYDERLARTEDNNMHYRMKKVSRGIKIGGYDERLGRNQDNEMHFRMKKIGYKLFYNPEIVSYHKSRDTFISFLKQKFGNGYWIGITIGIEPRCFALRHFVPFIFIIAVLFLILEGVMHSWGFLFTLLGVYFTVALYFTIIEEVKKESRGVRCLLLFLPFVIFSMHFVYGLGTLLGLFVMPFYSWKNKRYKIPRPIIE